MKILFYNHTAQVSGAERLLLMILSCLDRGKIDPVLVCPNQGPLPQMAESSTRVETVASLEARFTWQIGLLARYLKSFYEVIIQLRRQAIAINPDLIHANSIRSGLVATAATLGLRTPVIWHLHDLLPRHPFSSVIRLCAMLSGRTRMIAVSNAVADNFCGACPPLRQRVRVILNAIDLEKFFLDSSAGRQKREELSLGEAEVVIGIVGQITPRKGQLELLRAFAQALSEEPSITLLVVGAPLFNGDGLYEENLRTAVRGLGIEHKVRMLGARGDVASIMQALDLLVINSSAEPFGLVAVEAMASGTPVLATATGGLAEIIEHNQNGWLVPFGDEKALAAALVSLARQPALRHRLAEQGEKSATLRFSADRYMVELQCFYLNVLKRQTESEAQIVAARVV